MDAKKAVRKHEQRMHPEQFRKKPTFKKGGPTSLEMKQMGRNLAKVKNQRTK